MINIMYLKGEKVLRKDQFIQKFGVVMNILLAVVLALAVLLLLWLFAIAPQMKNRPDLSEFLKYDYAHRGLHNLEKGIPENTLKAFRLAAECGFGMEFDLQLTGDGEVVVHHDLTLKRTCGVEKNVNDLTLQELRQYRIAKTEEKIPTFQETLDAVGRRTPLIIELKGYNDPAELCTKVWEILKDYRGLYCIESFDPRIVKWFRENQPQVIRGQLMENLKPGKQLTALEALAGRNLLSNFLTRPNFEAYDYRSRKRPAMWAVRKLFGMQEASWTVKDWDTYYALKKEQCMIIFEGFEPMAQGGHVLETAEKAAPGSMTAPVNLRKL